MFKNSKIHESKRNSEANALNTISQNKTHNSTDISSLGCCVDNCNKIVDKIFSTLNERLTELVTEEEKVALLKELQNLAKTEILKIPIKPINIKSTNPPSRLDIQPVSLNDIKAVDNGSVDPKKKININNIKDVIASNKNSRNNRSVIYEEYKTNNYNADIINQLINTENTNNSGKNINNLKASLVKNQSNSKPRSEPINGNQRKKIKSFSPSNKLPLNKTKISFNSNDNYVKKLKDSFDCTSIKKRVQPGEPGNNKSRFVDHTHTNSSVLNNQHNITKDNPQFTEKVSSIAKKVGRFSVLKNWCTQLKTNPTKIRLLTEIDKNMKEETKKSISPNKETATHYENYTKSKLKRKEAFPLNNFMSNNVSRHSHDHSLQNNNKANTFIFNNHINNYNTTSNNIRYNSKDKKGPEVVSVNLSGTLNNSSKLPPKDGKDMIKQIKNNLDDDMKNFFNFSYDHYMNENGSRSSDSKPEKSGSNLNVEHENIDTFNHIAKISQVNEISYEEQDNNLKNQLFRNYNK